jgi:hypothetical protein
MSIPVEFSQDDLRRGELIDPDWYRVLITSVEPAVSKDGGSTNYNLKGTIIKNASNGDEKYNGYPAPHWNFNSKAMGFAQGYFKALGLELEAGKRYDLEYGVNKELDVMIENDQFQGRMVNRINHKYRAPKA